MEAVPATRLKAGADPAAEPWFEAALKKTENLHFAVPHVQRVFDAGENQYRWVISAARAVEITEGSSTEQGVLLIDIRYDSLEQLFDGITLGNGGYVYLLGADGELIYHPQSQLIYSGLEDENLEAAAEYRDGIHREEYKGKGRAVTVKTVGRLEDRRGGGTRRRILKRVEDKDPDRVYCCLCRIHPRGHQCLHFHEDYDADRKTGAFCERD